MNTVFRFCRQICLNPTRWTAKLQRENREEHMRDSELGWWRTVWETGSITECDWSAMCAPPKLCPSWCTAHSVSKTGHLLPTAPESNYLAAISRLLGKCSHLYLIFIFLACCLRNIYSNVFGRARFICAGCVFFLKARLSASVCPCTLSLSVLLCVKGVREKSLSQCMTLSNRLGIKLTTTKTFPAPKPIYTPIQASLMSALKSTTNSPRRKSLAHRGCSGCLSLRALACVYMRTRVGYVWECVHVCSCALVCTYVRARRLCLAPRWLTFFFFFINFHISRLYTSRPFLCPSAPTSELQSLFWGGMF